MKNRYKYKNNDNSFISVLRVAFFAILCYTAVMIGTIGGNIIFNLKPEIIINSDIQKFKSALNTTWPIIDTIYNSGKINGSIAGEIKKIVRGIFDFDLDKPLTILNSQSPMIYSYYYNSYLPKVAQNSRNNQASRGEENINGNTGENAAVTPTPKDLPDSSAPQPDNSAAPEEISSSIGYEEDEGQKGLDENAEIFRGKISIQNNSKYKLDNSVIDKLLTEPLNLKFDKNGPKVLIYHTHTSESYLDNLKNLTNKSYPNTDSDRNYNMIRVGDELADILKKKYNIDVVHNGTFHDYDYNKAYTASGKTVSTILKGNPSIRLVFDLHRDGLEEDKPKLRTVTKINGKNAAQVMFVVAAGHSNWMNNLKLAVKLQDALNQDYPGLARPICIFQYQYNQFNQNLSSGAMLIEIGGDGNTLEEALESTKYLAAAINSLINPKK